MGYRKLSPTNVAIFFCLAVVRSHWRGEVPTLREGAKQLGLSRELAPRLRKRLFDQLVALVARATRPGPRRPETPSRTAEKRIAVLESLLGLARAIIVSVAIAAVRPERRQDIVIAAEHLHTEHRLSYEEIAAQLGLCSRTLRRWRAEHRRGSSLIPKSRAPNKPHGKLPAPLARAIASFVSLFPAKIPLAELHRLFIHYNAELCAEHGHPKLSYGAFSRSSGRSNQHKQPSRTPAERGRDAPENLPFRALALMDTTDLKCFGFTFKLIAFMEAHSRVVFAHQLCERELAAEVKQVLEQGNGESGGVLSLRFDRGKPYLAELTVGAADEQHIDIRVARAHTPTDKATIERFFLTGKQALHDALGCVDLRDGPGELSWRRNLAHTIATRVIAAYLRWGYPYVPQPHIDGRTPHERTGDETSVCAGVIDQILEQRAQHHEHAKTVALEIHHSYGFRWSTRRWLRAVRRYPAEDLREAARRFDNLLLKGCFNCNPKRNPRYLLAIIRTVAAQRRQALARGQAVETEHSRHEAQVRKVREEEQRRRQFPEQAISEALEMGTSCWEARGLVQIASHWLDQALESLAHRGPDAYRLATESFAARISQDPVRRWFADRLEVFRPPPRPLRTDLKV